jgi:tetratricopeptide (TPR) repeat protein
MLLNWFNAREAAEAGTALADDFLQQSESGSRSARRRVAGDAQATAETQRILQKFLQRVDREARPLKLNLFKRARLANSFKWRLLEQGVDSQVVEELTRAVVLRIGGAGSSAAVPVEAGRRAGASQRQALQARANELLGKGAYGEALQSYQELVGADARDAGARNGLGIALAQLGQYREAEAEFRRAIGIKPSFPEAYFNLGGVLEVTGRYNEAEVPLRRALKLKPSYLDARVRLGTSFVLQGRIDEARDSFEKALRVAPRHPQALVGLGQTEALGGKFTAAEALYRRALEADKGAFYAWAGLAWLRKMTAADAAWVKRAEEFADSGLAAIDECTMRFAIGKYYNDTEDFPKAFRNYQRANELHKQRAEPYDRAGHVRFVDDMVRIYTKEALGQTGAGGSDSERPVLVLGMPRSGTSLVEQIIASHPAAAGAGELNVWSTVVRKHETVLRQQLLEAPLRKRVAEDYLQVLAGYSGSAQRVVDKAPANADYVGLIHSVFPKARIIYLQRDPIDTCLSCYLQQLQPALNFTMDLTDLAHYYRQHRRLMDHWRSVLPPHALLEVPYAELVADQEKWTRRIVEFLGLPWDPQTLEFHQNNRAVTTASAWQVRQKIYKTSVQRWRHYKKFIGPLLELGDSTT